MVGTTNSLNQIQKLDVNVRIINRTVAIGTTEVTLYTCPANKAALVKSYQRNCDNLGANSFIRWKAAGGSVARITATDTQLVEMAGNGIRLEAGETLAVNGDAVANNGSADFVIGIQELNA